MPSPHKWLLLLFLMARPVLASESYYPSGLFQALTEKNPKEVVSEAQAESDFFSRYLDKKENCRWEKRRRLVDGTHVHLRYVMYCHDRRVLGQFVDLHYHHGGWVEYASSTWKERWEIGAVPAETRAVENYVERWRSFRRSHFRTAKNEYAQENVFFPAGGNAVAAIELKLSGFNPSYFADIVLDEVTGKVLEQRPAVRHAVTTQAWKISPYNGGTNDEALDAVSISGNEADSTKLSSSFIHVKRQENTTTPVLQEVDASSVVAPASPDTDTPAHYWPTCTGDADCKEHRFNAVNVYYHIQNFRDSLLGYFSDLGMESPTLDTDPILVIVNNFTVDFNGNGAANESNNAGYVPRACTDDGSEERCLSFVRPAQINMTVCNGLADFYNLAREAMVIVHEYQHYVTDSIVVLTQGTITTPNVGDALHEGYSDYFAASQVTALNGTNVTKIGEYGFQDCPYFSRDIGDLKVYEDGDAVSDAHVSGQSWASGLWQLREELGRDTVDKLALKSLTFLSSVPGFIEAVEALVKADQALNSGSNVARIRTLFYSDIKFVGGDGTVFRDPANGIIEVGFHSCISVPISTTPLDWARSIGLFGVWILSLLACGRAFRGRS